MAKHLDLEEQEQLDELKHFWKQYGDLITWTLITVLGAFAAWNGYQYWQRAQAAKAAVMYEEIERAVQSGEPARIDRSLSEMKERFGRTTFAEQGALLAAKAYQDKGSLDASQGALKWVAENGADVGYQSVARLRSASILVEKKAYAEALQLLAAPFPSDFSGLVADRRGDIYMAQGKKAEAKIEYNTAWKAMDERAEYRRMVEVKLNALGVDTASATELATAEKSKDSK